MDGGALEEVSYILEAEDKLCFSYYCMWLQGESKMYGKWKMAQLFNLFRFKLKKLVTEFFRLEQWGKVLQSKIVAPSKEAWFERR